MKNEKNKPRLYELGLGVYLIFLTLFALVSLYYRLYYVAAGEAAVILVLLVYAVIIRRRRQKQLKEYVEAITYQTDGAKSSTMVNFPLPIAVFRMEDSSIVWGNELFFDMLGDRASRVDAKIFDLVPEFDGAWLEEGKKVYPRLLEVDGKKYQLHGKLIQSKENEEDQVPMAVSYWLDVTEYDDIRLRYEKSRPVPAIIVIDNLDELFRNQPDRVKSDLRDAVEDRLHRWAEPYNGILLRYDRNRYLAVLEHADLQRMKEDKFSVVQEMHQVESPNGIGASISIGFGDGADSLGEGLQYADKALELALSRGGDQTVIKNRLNFEFYGGRGLEVEKRTKVKSRVMANTLFELMKDSSRVMAMGHRFADLDALGAAVGVCAMARKCGVRCQIVRDQEHNAVAPLVERLKKEPEYRDLFLSPREAEQIADGRTLLVVVDTNRPEQVEDAALLDSCGRVAVIDHHRVAATYIHNAALGFIEPYASSACELLTEILQEVLEQSDLLRCEAEALLSGIVLDTKSFSIRTGERTFDAAAYLRRAGADTTEVKKLFQTDMEATIARYKIMQSAKIYRNVAIAAPEEPQLRVVAAKAADELLNISGVDASVVVAPDGRGSCYVSARSIGEVNVQILMEKLGGGGNRSAAAAQFKDMEIREAVEKVYAAIDDYFGS